MWQRIQTVFLVVTVLVLLISLIQPVWIGPEGSDLVLTPFYLKQGDQYSYLPYSIIAILSVAGITIALIEIKRYDNRVLQLKLGVLNTLILVGLMVSSILFSSNLSEEHPTFHYGIGLYMTFAAVLCNWLAVRFIRRDERLVRDSDRLR